MNYAFWQSIASTSWWFCLLTIYLVYIAYLATKPQVRDIRILYFVLVTSILLTLLGMFTLITITPANVSAYFATLFASAITGWALCFRLNIKAVEGKKLLLQQGSWMISFIVFLIFCGRIYFGNNISLDPAAFKTPTYSLVTIMLYGWATGIILGKIFFMRRVLEKGPFISVSETEGILSLSDN